MRSVPNPSPCLPRPLIHLLHPPVPTPILFHLHLHPQPHPPRPPRPLLPHPSRHRREKQGSVQLKVTIPEMKYLHSSRSKGLSAGSGSDDKIQGTNADQCYDEGASNGSSSFRNVAGPARAQVECPPSLAALFHPHLTSEEDVDSLRFSSRGHIILRRRCAGTHSSSSPSPVDTVVKSDVFSDSHDTLSPTPASALAPVPTRSPTPTPISRLPSLLTRKPSACKSQSGTGGNKTPKSGRAVMGSGDGRYAPAPPLPFPSFAERDSTSCPFEQYDPAFPGVWAAEGEGMGRGVESGGYGGGCERVEGARSAVTVWSCWCTDGSFSPIFRVRSVYVDVPRVRAKLDVALL